MNNIETSLLWVLILTLLNVGCEPSSSDIEKSDNFYKYDISLPIRNSDFKDGVFKYSKICNAFYFFSSKSKTLISYTAKGEVIDSIDLTKVPVLNDFYVSGKDSIYLSLENINKILLINSKGEIIREYKFNLRDIKTPFYMYNYADFPLIVNDNVVYTHHYIENETTPENLPDYFSNPRELVFSLVDSVHLKYKIGKFPKNYIDGDYSEMNMKRTFGHNRNIVYSFEASDSIFIYNNDGKLILSIDPKTKYFHKNKPIDAKNIPKENYFNEIIKYTVENDRYANMIFSEKTNLYLRTLKRGIPYNNGDGTKNTVEDCPWLLLMYNDKFDLIKTVEFQPAKYIIYSMILAQDDIILIPYLNENQDETNFAVFNFL
jgi:hypothetical protein